MIEQPLSYLVYHSCSSDEVWFGYYRVDINLMSFLYFGNVPASVPPVFDTTPCMKEMLQYEDCVFE